MKFAKPLHFNVYKTEPNFDISLTVPGQAEEKSQKITLEPGNLGVKSYDLLLKNNTGHIRTVIFEPLQLQGLNNTLSPKIRPEKIRVEAQGQEIIKLDFSNSILPARGIYSGWLVIKDKAMQKLKRHFWLEVQPNFSFFSLTFSEIDKRRYP